MRFIRTPYNFQKVEQKIRGTSTNPNYMISPLVTSVDWEASHHKWYTNKLNGFISDYRLPEKFGEQKYWGKLGC